MNPGNLTAALFIDADNLGPNAVAQAFEHLSRRFASVGIRRAYGGHQKLNDLKDVLRKYGIRAYVNQGKGTTDVALVVDMMDLLHQSALPQVVALASSDADFAPLALRLREAGLSVLCFAQKDKAAEADLASAYGEVIFVTDTSLSVVAPTGAEKRPPLVPKPQATVAKVTPAGGGPVKKSEEGTHPLIQEVPPNEVDAQAVRRILEALPKWLPDTVKQLNQLGTPLQEKGIKKGNKPLHELFRRYPTYFKVLPTTGQPRQVRLLQNP